MVAGADLTLQVGHSTLEGFDVGLKMLEFIHRALERRDVGPCSLEVTGSMV
jgi:hypothetical protein